MLNLVCIDIADRHLLENSYNACREKEAIDIITDSKEKELIFRKTIDTIRTPADANFSFQNLFKLKTSTGCFYIAQCLVDFGYPVGSRRSQTFVQKYSYQLIGIANTKVDLGVSQLRPETKLDKIISRFFNNDINFDGSEKFNEKYFLVSDSKTGLSKYFDKPFLHTIAKYDDILLTTNGRWMFISFDNELASNQTRIAQDIFSSFQYLEKG